eukprot:TRINITY_DN3168_c0_g1_i1.p1 TRINITY_DN3168_c0_g1~~TRINITY_DN3168_c0_g1_i1.p1  ORF type:complete len:196 (-),score=48.15 TRINITY_DN3168_c0_g1_i1:16-603(-)
MIVSGRLRVLVEKAVNLKQTNYFGQGSDTYVVLKLKNEYPNGSQIVEKRTSIQKNNREPQYGQLFEFEPCLQLDTLFVTVMGSKTFGDVVIGDAEIPISIVASKPKEKFDCWFNLLEKTDPLLTGGSIHLILKFIPKSAEKEKEKEKEKKEEQEKVETEVEQNSTQGDPVEQHIYPQLELPSYDEVISEENSKIS